MIGRFPRGDSGILGTPCAFQMYGYMAKQNTIGMRMGHGYVEATTAEHETQSGKTQRRRCRNSKRAFTFERPLAEASLELIATLVLTQRSEVDRGSSSGIAHAAP